MTVKDTDFAVMKEIMQELKDDMKRIKTVLVDGNGQKPMTVRLDTAERLSSHVPKVLTDINMMKGGIAALSVILIGLQVWTLVR